MFRKIQKNRRNTSRSPNEILAKLRGFSILKKDLMSYFKIQELYSRLYRILYYISSRVEPYERRNSTVRLNYLTPNIELILL